MIDIDKLEDDIKVYPSDKVLPYVYKCIHKFTGKIYIGSRTSKNQKLPSNEDFAKYKTSSKIVKPKFDEYYWYIVAEFFDAKSAYTHEQYLIYEQWNINKSLSLNRVCHHKNNTGFNSIGKILTQDERELRRKMMYSITEDGIPMHLHIKEQQIEKMSKPTASGLTGYQVAAQRRYKTMITEENEEGEKIIDGMKRKIKEHWAQIDDKTGKTLGRIHYENTLGKYNYSGENNPAARLIHIYDDKDNLIFVCNGSFRKTIKKYNLPSKELYRSLKNGGTKIMMNMIKAQETYFIKTGKIKYRGWYAKYMDMEE